MAVEKYHFPPFIDGSCRREPDFESRFPSISALCRGKVFAPRLHVGDVIVYKTVKGSYLGVKPPHWRLVAILNVIRRFKSHNEAANWYQSNELPLPANCMVPGNNSAPFEMTAGILKLDFEKRTKGFVPTRIIRMWDATYQERAKKWGVFLVCKPVFLDLNNPLILTEDDMTGLFGHVLNTFNPPEISDEFVARLIE
jgi:hypothetical protein